MEEKTINLNDLMVVEQMPKIRETLGVISQGIDKEIEKALSLDCTEESKTEVKKSRANLNKIKNALEDRKKQVKEQIMSPYLQFESVYNELVKEKLTNADNILRERISAIEIEQRERKVQEILSFVKEWLEYYELRDFIEPKSIVPKVTLSASLKSIKEQIKGEIERIANDIKVIKTEEISEELLVEYLENGFDYAKAKLKVFERHQKIEELKVNDYQDNTDIVEPIVEEELIECTFTVNATKEQLIQIKNYLQELGVKYE